MCLLNVPLKTLPTIYDQMTAQIPPYNNTYQLWADYGTNAPLKTFPTMSRQMTAQMSPLKTLPTIYDQLTAQFPH